MIPNFRQVVLELQVHHILLKYLTYFRQIQLHWADLLRFLSMELGGS